MIFTYLGVDDFALLAAELGTPDIRDIGLLDSAAHRPRATAFGEDAYPDLPTKTAALLSSIARNRALIDGNKRLAWLVSVAFCDLNGHDLSPPNVDAAYALVISAATGESEVTELAPVLASWIVAF